MSKNNTKRFVFQKTLRDFKKTLRAYNGLERHTARGPNVQPDLCPQQTLIDSCNPGGYYPNPNHNPDPDPDLGPDPNGISWH